MSDPIAVPSWVCAVHTTLPGGQFLEYRGQTSSGKPFWLTHSPSSSLSVSTPPLRLHVFFGVAEEAQALADGFSPGLEMYSAQVAPPNQRIAYVYYATADWLVVGDQRSGSGYFVNIISLADATLGFLRRIGVSSIQLVSALHIHNDVLYLLRANSVLRYDLASLSSLGSFDSGVLGTGALAADATYLYVVGNTSVGRVPFTTHIPEPTLFIAYSNLSTVTAVTANGKLWLSTRLSEFAIRAYDLTTGNFIDGATSHRIAGASTHNSFLITSPSGVLDTVAKQITPCSELTITPTSPVPAPPALPSLPSWVCNVQTVLDDKMFLEYRGQTSSGKPFWLTSSSSASAPALVLASSSSLRLQVFASSTEEAQAIAEGPADSNATGFEMYSAEVAPPNQRIAYVYYATADWLVVGDQRSGSGYFVNIISLADATLSSVRRLNVSSIQLVSALHIHNDVLYLLRSNSVWRYDLASLSLLGSFDSGVLGTGALAADATYLYVVGDTSVVRVPFTTHIPEPTLFIEYSNLSTVTAVTAGGKLWLSTRLSEFVIRAYDLTTGNFVYGLTESRVRSPTKHTIYIITSPSGIIDTTANQYIACDTAVVDVPPVDDGDEGDGFPPSTGAAVASGQFIDSIVYLQDDVWLARIKAEITDFAIGSGPTYLARVDARTGTQTRLTDFPVIQLPSSAKLAGDGLGSVYGVIDTLNPAYVPSLSAPYQFDYSVNALAISGDGLFLYAGTTDGLFVYHRDVIGADWEVKVTLCVGEHVQAVDVNPSHTHVAVGLTAGNRVRVFKRSGFVYTDILSFSSSSCRAIKYSPNGEYLAIGRDAAPRLTFYKVTGDTYTVLSFASTAPTGTVYGIAWSPSNDYLVVVHATSPFVSLYSRNVDVFTKLANPASLPATTGWAAAFSPDDTSLLVGIGSSPWVIRYDHDGVGGFTRNFAVPSGLTTTVRSFAFRSAATESTGTITGSGALAGQGETIRNGTGTITGSGAMAGTGETPFVGVNAGLGAITGSGALAGLGETLRNGTGAITGSGALAGVGKTLAAAITRVFIGTNADLALTKLFAWDYAGSEYAAGPVVTAAYQSGIQSVVVHDDTVFAGSNDYPVVEFQSCIGQYAQPTYSARGVYKSGSDGTSWSHLYDFAADVAVDNWYVNDQPVAAIGNYVFCGVTVLEGSVWRGAIYRSDDAGGTWSRVYGTSTDFPDSAEDGCDITAIGVMSNGTVIAAIHTYGDSSADYVVASEDFGATWGEFVLVEAPPIWIRSIGYVRETWFLSGEGRVYQSFSAGGSWQRTPVPQVGTYIGSISSGHPDIIGVVNPDPNSSSNVGVLISLDVGQTWQEAAVTWPVVDPAFANDSGSSSQGTPALVGFGGTYWAYAAENSFYFRRRITGVAPPSIFDLQDTLALKAELSYVFALALHDRVPIRIEQAFERHKVIQLLVSLLGADAAQLRTEVESLDQHLIVASSAFSLSGFLLDVMRAHTQTETYYHGAQAVLSRLKALASALPADAAQVLSELSIESTTLIQLRRVATMLDELESVVSAVGKYRIGFLVVDALGVRAITETSAALIALLKDHLLPYTVFRLSDEAHTGWVMNLQGDMPLSRYDNFGFNSFCKVEQTYYAASDNGVYSLHADDDAGDPIDAALTTMMLDFGSPSMKRVRAAYVGYTADERLLLKVRSVTDGVLNEQWYEMQPVRADAPRENMIRLGRGARSRYWQFELVNVDGADFEIADMELHPVYLNRRV